MKKIYEYQNGTVHISLSDSFNQEYLKKATQEFLKKVISEGNQNGNSNTSTNFREKQILY